MKKILLALGIVFLGLAILLAWFVPSAFIGAPADVTVSFTIPKGADIGDVAGELARKGVIASSFGYKLFSYIDRSATQPKAGEYAIPPGTSYREIARKLALGPARDEISIRILEGLTIDEAGLELAKWGVGQRAYSDLVGMSGNKKPFSSQLRQEFGFLKELPADASLEGYLYPETYRVWRDQLPLGFVLKQLQEFRKQTEGFVEEAAKQGRSFREVVILASMLEKEGRTSEERRMIAGIFMNRMKIGMRLQADSTVNYVTGAGRSRVTLKDLEVDSPYNTYRNEGLPPGPICNPSKASLEAALRPTASEYYFYLHDESGKIYYAKNAEEHKVNRWKAYGE